MMQVGTVAPCGFCGLDGCTLALVHKSRGKTEIKSNCQYHYDFSLGAATVSSVTSPSTNVPLHCPLCLPDPKTGRMPAFWKYNIDSHTYDTHNVGLPRAVNDLPVASGDATSSTARPAVNMDKDHLRAKHISLREMNQLGIPPEAARSWREAADIPNTSDIEASDDDRGIGKKSGQKRRATGGTRQQIAKRRK